VAIPRDLIVGSELAGYRIERVLGRGGMSIVYRAYDPRLKRAVALKLMAPNLAEDEGFRRRFLRESELAASLEHPNVIPIHDVGDAGGQLFMVMRLVEGADLKALLRSEGALAPARALAIVSQVASALDAAHAKGLVHRDVKPSNVLLDEHEHVYLADFGLTKRVSEGTSSIPEAGSMGTIDYVAPEQIRGEEVDGRADIYSLGCLLYECLTGEPPYPRSSDLAVLFAHLEEEPPAGEGFDEVLARALAKDPNDRYETCGELVEQAREALGIAEPRRARWPLAVVGVGVALLGAALLAFGRRVDSRWECRCGHRPGNESSGRSGSRRGSSRGHRLRIRVRLGREPRGSDGLSNRSGNRCCRPDAFGRGQPDRHCLVERRGLGDRF